MWVRVLGSAAGGAFPQWNCDCPGCCAVRAGSRPSRARSQSSIAVSADCRSWILLNASPDLAAQLESFPALRPRNGRTSPVQAILLTDAELDHTLGLLLLRQAPAIELHATAAVHKTLRDGTGLLRTLAAYCRLDWHEVVADTATTLRAGLSYHAFEVPTSKPARFGARDEPGRVVGYRITEENTGRVLVYVPGAQQLSPPMLKQLADTDCLLFDGTCWRDDELTTLGMGRKTSREMGHLPIAGTGGSLELLERLPIRRKIYVHINNTNPILLEDSPEREHLDQRGFEVAADGLEVRV